MWIDFLVFATSLWSADCYSVNDRYESPAMRVRCLVEYNKSIQTNSATLRHLLGGRFGLVQKKKEDQSLFLTDKHTMTINGKMAEGDATVSIGQMTWDDLQNQMGSRSKFLTLSSKERKNYIRGYQSKVVRKNYPDYDPEIETLSNKGPSQVTMARLKDLVGIPTSDPLPQEFEKWLTMDDNSLRELVKQNKGSFGVDPAMETLAKNPHMKSSLHKALRLARLQELKELDRELDRIDRQPNLRVNNRPQTFREAYLKRPAAPKLEIPPEICGRLKYCQDLTGIGWQQFMEKNYQDDLAADFLEAADQKKAKSCLSKTE